MDTTRKVVRSKLTDSIKKKDSIKITGSIKKKDGIKDSSSSSSATDKDDVLELSPSGEIVGRAAETAKEPAPIIRQNHEIDKSDFQGHIPAGRTWT